MARSIIERLVDIMTFEVHYTDGNKKLFESKSMTELMRYLLENEQVDYIWKIEER